MIRSLAVILIPLLVITFLTTRNLRDHPVQVVDWKPVLAQARREAPYPVLAPINLPKEWRATRVSWVKIGQPDLGGQPAVRNTWQLGFLNPDDIYIALDQGDRDAAQMIQDETRGGVVDGTSRVTGVVWQRRVSPDDRTRSLVLSTAKVTTIIVGDTSYSALEAYAGTLEAH
jgi:Protein of unknown function (DUF4245)